MNDYSINFILEIWAVLYTINTQKILIHLFTFYNKIGLGSNPNFIFLVSLSKSL